MACQRVGNAYICGLPDYRAYICFEHITYLFEFNRMFGPSWFRMPGEVAIYPEPDGHMSVLWDIFDEWIKEFQK